MAELTEAAYQDIRNYIQDNWKVLGIKNSDGVVFKKLQVDGTKVRWTNTSGARVLELKAALTGTDFTLPVTVAGACLFKTTSDTDPIHDESFNPVDVEFSDDRININFTIEVPIV